MNYVVVYLCARVYVCIPVKMYAMMYSSSSVAQHIECKKPVFVT